MQQISKKPNSNHGFTIVELLVVIVVIGILAAITIVSYTGISQRAKVAALQSDLTNSSKQIKLFQVTEASGNYPIRNNCPTPSATEICLKASGTNEYTYTPSNGTNPKAFTLIATNGATVYQITNDSSPTIAPASLAVTDPANWLTIGTQVWAKYNLNVGNRIDGINAQTNNSYLEKYCYNDDDSNCIANGGLYQWGEAMQYVATPTFPAVAQGICPAGSHIPSDAEWKTLEMQLGMTQVQADATGWRGTDQGTKLKVGGSSGLEVPLAGLRYNDGYSFNYSSSNGYLWSSSESNTSAWDRYVNLSYTTMYRNTYDKGYGLSVRCLGNSI